MEENKDITTQTITLDEPLKRGDSQIEQVTIRKPSSGELRGVSLAALGELDVTALQRVLPRITNPTLTQQDVANMAPADLMQCGVAVAGFLLKKSMRREAFQTE
jgi:hypothetical protein